MLETIEKLLILQDRDQKIRRVQGELAHIEPERQTLKAKAATAQAELENAKLRIKQIESARKDLELEVEAKKQMIVRYANQQFQTRKNEEYRALAARNRHVQGRHLRDRGPGNRADGTGRSGAEGSPPGHAGRQGRAQTRGRAGRATRRAGRESEEGVGRTGSQLFWPASSSGVPEVITGVDDAVDDLGLRRRLQAHVDEIRADGIASAEVAGPGFINMRLEASAQAKIVNNVIDAGEDYGHSDALAGQKINLEFVSANPTGPIHIGGTRWAAVGDALGRLLSTQGADVIREYYFNDHGAQIDRFASSLIAAAKGEPTPEDGYAGSYITDIAAQVLQKAPDALEPARRREARDASARSAST